MRTWRRGRALIGVSLAVADLACAAVAWLSPWLGYAATLVTIVTLVALRSPPEAENRFEAEAA